MPSRHSKNSGDRHHFTHNEKVKAGLGSISQRLGTESQLPFGYCCLSMHPSVEPVVSPSGHIYSREFILEYLLTKSKELKKLTKAYEEQQAAAVQSLQQAQDDSYAQSLQNFADTQDGVAGVLKRKLTETGGGGSSSSSSNEYQQARKKVIDDTDTKEKMDQLRKVSPWIPQFTPAAKDSDIKEPPKRPPSPITGRPLRSKDLIPIDLVKDTANDNAAGSTRYLCPVSRKTITNQPVVLIKTTGALMLEQAAKDLAYPDMTCPITGKKFKVDDVLVFASAASGFAASGPVVAKVHRPNFN